MKPTYYKEEYKNDGAQHTNPDGSCRHNADMKDRVEEFSGKGTNAYMCRYCPTVLIFGNGLYKWVRNKLK